MSFDPDAGLKVLIVEDNPLALWTGRRSLEEMGCHVSEASTCFEAEEIWKANSLDLIIMDYRLPDGLGTDVLDRMRNIGYNTLTICVTAEAEVISDEQRDKLGICTVLNKPLDIDILRKTVMHICASSGGHGPTHQPATPGTETSRLVIGRCKVGTAEHGDINNSRRIGKFHVVKCPAKLNYDAVIEINGQYDDTEWVALDMRNTHEADDKAISLLLRMSDRHSECRGRFCLAGLPEKLRQHLEKLGLDRKIDMLRDIKGLEPLGRRLTSTSERMSVLDSVVTRS